MNRVISQKELGNYLANNPLHVAVHVGDLDNMNGKDYIFLDYLYDRLIPFDDNGCYKTSIQISVYVKDFASRKVLVDYIKQLSPFNIDYDSSNEGNYFIANMTAEFFLK